MRAINFPGSHLGESDERLGASMAGIAETKRTPVPPTATDFEPDFWFRDHELEIPTGVADWRIQFFGSKGPDRSLSGVALSGGLGHWSDDGSPETRRSR